MKLSGVNRFTSLDFKTLNSRKLNNNTNNLKENFALSSSTSNAIRLNAMNNISFRANLYASNLALSAIEKYSTSQSLHYSLVQDCLKEAKGLMLWVLEDLETNDEMVEKTRRIEDGRIVLSKTRRLDRFGDPYYEAQYTNGKPTTIKTFDVNGLVESVIRYDENSGDVLSYQRGDSAKDFEYLFEFAKGKNGETSPKVYLEDCSELDDGTLFYSKKIQYLPSGKIIYKENVNAYPDEEEISVLETFNFKSQDTFTHENAWSIHNGGRKNCKKTRVKNFCEI